MAKNKNKKSRKVREKKNLSIANYGDTVVIRNRSLIGGGILGTLTVAFCIAMLFVLRDAWDVAIFWIVYPFILLSSIYSLINTLFGRIVLDSPNMLMTVYMPFKAVYKFSDINYIDLKSSKKQEGYITHTVTVYIGDGKRCVNVDTLSAEQAEELTSLFRGMLDNAAMEYPEGNEEPFNFDDDKKDKKSEGFADKLADVCASFILSVGKLFKKKEKKTEEDEPVEFITKGETLKNSGSDARIHTANEDEVEFVPLMEKVEHNNAENDNE